MRIIVPFPAGGTADAVPRLVADWLSRKWGQPVVIENHTGAGGNIGAELVYRARARRLHPAVGAAAAAGDQSEPLSASSASIRRKFEPIVVMAQVPNALFVNPNKIKARACPN